MRNAAAFFSLLVLAAPAAAAAQSSWERRADDNLRQLDQTMRIDDVARRLDNIEIRQRTQANLQSLEAPRGPATIQDNPYTRSYDYTAPLTPAQVAIENRARDAELAASNARLRAIAAQQRAEQDRR